MTCLPAYWSALELAFHGVLQQLGEGRDSLVVQRNWTVAIRQALREAWAQHQTATQTSSAWALRALAQAEGPIAVELKKLEASILEFNTYLAEESS
jgi:hypothetical protein